MEKKYNKKKKKKHLRAKRAEILFAIFNIEKQILSLENQIL